MKIIEVRSRTSRQWLPHNLNVRQLLNPIFFDHMWPLGEPHPRRRPDMKRQHSRRQRAKDLKAARELKTAYVPLCFVDPTVYLERYDAYEGRFEPLDVVYADLLRSLEHALSVTMRREA